MRVQVRARIARHHGDVRLRLRVRVERDRELRVDLPGIAERAPQRGQHAPDRRRVPASLRLADDQQAVEELQALAGLEHAQVDQPLVLDARPVPGPGRRDDGGGHRVRSVTNRYRPVNVHERTRYAWISDGDKSTV